MQTASIGTYDELVGLLIFVLIVIIALRPWLAIERLVARKAAGIKGPATYTRNTAGILTARRVTA